MRKTQGCPIAELRSAFSDLAAMVGAWGEVRGQLGDAMRKEVTAQGHLVFAAKTWKSRAEPGLSGKECV